MPDHLAERIKQTLATEAAARAEATRAAATDHPTPVRVPGRPELPERTKPRRWRPRMPDLSSPAVLRLVAATGAVVVIAGASLLLANQAPSKAPHHTFASGSTVPSAPPANLPLGHVAPVSVNYLRNGQLVTTDVLATKTNYTPRTIRLQALSQKKSVTRLQTNSPAPTTAGANGMVGGISFSHLSACLTQISAGRKVLFVDIGKFLHRPAVIIIMRAANPLNVLDVSVVSLACSASNTRPIATLQVPKS